MFLFSGKGESKRFSIHEACKTRPVHATNENLQPVEVLPLFPDFDRYELTVL